MLKNLRESFKTYKRLSDDPIDIKDYLIITAEFNKFIIDKVLEGEEVVLPERLGNLSVIGKEQKIQFDAEGKVSGLAPDWVGTRKLWDEDPHARESKTILYHTNEHSDNIRYKYLWSKKRMLVRNKTLYSLKLTRGNKRALHKRIMEGIEYLIK